MASRGTGGPRRPGRSHGPAATGISLVLRLLAQRLYGVSFDSGERNVFRSRPFRPRQAS